MDIKTIFLIILVALASNQLAIKLGFDLMKIHIYVDGFSNIFKVVFLLIISYYLGKYIQIGVNKVRGTKNDNSLASKGVYTIIMFIIVLLIIDSIGNKEEQLF